MERWEAGEKLELGLIVPDWQSLVEEDRVHKIYW